MPLQDLVLRTQLLPPRSRKGVLRRPRLQARLQAALDIPLTIVQAGTGYGKSTALAALVDLVPCLFWYTITEPERDPLLFLVHLLAAFDRPGCPAGAAALRALEESGGRVTPVALTPLLNTLATSLEGEAVLVLDDYHLVQDVPEISALLKQLVNYRPPGLHLVLSTRQPPPFDDLPRWRAKGQALTLGRAELAFTVDEIEALFREYGRTLAPGQAQLLAAETEGWAIALQMVWQSLQSGAAPHLEAVFERLPDTLEALFDYLAPEVLARQSPADQHFLLTSSVLRRMSGPACDLLLDACGSEATLRRLYESGLFVDTDGEGGYRYQKLFHDFLQAEQARDAAQSRSLHRRAADYFSAAGQPEETIYHLLNAAEFERAADQIEALGPQWIALGRLDSLSLWMGRLPEALRATRPALNLLRGDMLRLRADFDAALEAYAVAEQLYAAADHGLGRSRALRGQAQVYLDTVRPLKADALLEEASRLLEPQEHRLETAALFDQLAENKLNLGFPDLAQTLHAEARLLRAESDPGDVYLEARALLRTGRLADARRLLEELQLEDEDRAEPTRPQRFHREARLLLSLICALQGDGAAAERHARAGITTGQRLQSDFVEAVGAMRLGHPLQMGPVRPWGQNGYAQAIGCYRQAIEQVRPFKVSRVGVEPLWGLCRAHGYSGDLAVAGQFALQAVEIATQSGDEWMGDLTRTSMGAGLALAGQAEVAVQWLQRAAEGFRRVGDPYGEAAAGLWLALNAWGQGDVAAALDLLGALLPIVDAHGYDDLLLRRTLLGLKDDQAFLPLLLAARRHHLYPTTVARLLGAAGLEAADEHPGYTLWVRTLGPLGVWRGDTPVAAHEWQREKARQLFLLLVTQRGQFLQREQIADLLWPDLPADAAGRDFKVALNALHRALEPGRAREAQPFFVVRRANAYGLNPAARVEVDADHFERLVVAAGEGEEKIHSLRQALALYEQDYLPDCRYDDWAELPRQRLAQLYQAAAGRLAQLSIAAGAWEEAIAVCQAALGRDVCWEPGYRLLMQAYAGQGNTSQVQNSFNRCVAALGEELGVEPSPETRALLVSLKSR